MANINSTIRRVWHERHPEAKANTKTRKRDRDSYHSDSHVSYSSRKVRDVSPVDLEANKTEYKHPRNGESRNEFSFEFETKRTKNNRVSYCKSITNGKTCGVFSDHDATDDKEGSKMYSKKHKRRLRFYEDARAQAIHDDQDLNYEYLSRSGDDSETPSDATDDARDKNSYKYYQNGRKVRDAFSMALNINIRNTEENAYETA